MGRVKDLFGEEAHTRWSDPDTSFEAADKVTPKLKKIQTEVYLLFKAKVRMTDLELQRAFGSSGSTHRTRRAELVELGLIRDSGKRVKQDGSNRIIWEIVPDDGS